MSIESIASQGTLKIRVPGQKPTLHRMALESKEMHLLILAGIVR